MPYCVTCHDSYVYHVTNKAIWPSNSKKKVIKVLIAIEPEIFKVLAILIVVKDFIGHMTDGDRDFKNGVCQLCFGLLSNFGT